MTVSSYVLKFETAYTNNYARYKWLIIKSINIGVYHSNTQKRLKTVVNSQYEIPENEGLFEELPNKFLQFFDCYFESFCWRKSRPN